MSDGVIIALIGAIATVAVAIIRKLNGIHKQINSRMDELLELNRRSSKAEGKLEERAERDEEIKNKK